MLSPAHRSEIGICDEWTRKILIGGNLIHEVRQRLEAGSPPTDIQTMRGRLERQDDRGQQRRRTSRRVRAGDSAGAEQHEGHACSGEQRELAHRTGRVHSCGTEQRVLSDAGHHAGAKQGSAIDGNWMAPKKPAEGNEPQELKSEERGSDVDEPCPVVQQRREGRLQRGREASADRDLLGRRGVRLSHGAAVPLYSTTPGGRFTCLHVQFWGVTISLHGIPRSPPLDYDAGEQWTSPRRCGVLSPAPEVG